MNQLNTFIRVSDNFQELRSIQKQNRAKTNPKRTEDVVENVKNFVQESPRNLDSENLDHKFLALKPFCGES